MHIYQIQRSACLITIYSLFVLMLQGCSRDASDSVNGAANPATEDVASVSVLPLQPTKWNIEIETYGQVRAVEEVQISVDFSGDVVEVLFE